MEISNIKEIEDAFDKVVKYSQNLSGEVHSEELFADWMKNKDFFFRAFLNNQLIREFGEVSFHLSDAARSKTFSNMDYKNQNTFRDVVGLAMRAGYEQARLDRIKELSKRNIPLFQWSENEYDYVGYNYQK